MDPAPVGTGTTRLRVTSTHNPLSRPVQQGGYMPFDFSTIDAGATAWVLASAALVLIMTPGVAFFYGGMVRAKHVLGMLKFIGTYSIAFGGANKYWGGLHFMFLNHYDQQVPGYTDALSQVIPPL